jgi:prepilin-type N-terminal cleavage/methylation domain-containing protein/prepilin-type processing-associated H-X9-DG protein
MRTRSTAFTLIELLVVIAIIAILAAILFPVFAQAREKARAISCVSNEKQISLGILMYIQDYDETLPLYWYGVPSQPTDPPFTPSVSESQFGWNEAIYPYVKNIQLFRCPDSPRSADLTTGANGQTGFGTSDSGPTGATGYSINARISGDNWQEDHTPSPTVTALSDAALSWPAVTILLTESSSNCSDGCASSDENEWGWEGRHVDKLYGNGWDYGSEPPSAGASFISSGLPPLTRHTGGANYAFSDGHVKFLNAGSMGLVTNPNATTAQVEAAAAVSADNTGQKPTYCPDSNCQYNVPIVNQ